MRAMVSCVPGGCERRRDYGTPPEKETPADAAPAGVLGPSREKADQDLPLLAAGLLAGGLLATTLLPSCLLLRGLFASCHTRVTPPWFGCSLPTGCASQVATRR